MKNIFSKQGRPVLLAVMMGFSVMVSAQDGPGGVGSANGTSHLKLWLRADKGVYSDGGGTAATNGQLVQQWNDQSGNGLNALQNTPGSRPGFTTTGFNGFPAVSFTGGAKFLPECSPQHQSICESEYHRDCSFILYRLCKRHHTLLQIMGP